MDTTNFLENLAKETHYSLQFNNLIIEQSLEVQLAIRKNNSILIQNQFLEIGYLANASTCINLNTCSAVIEI